MRHLYSKSKRQSQQSAQDKTEDMYQIEPFEIEQNRLTNEQVNSMIQNWDSFGKIQEKFYAWEFSFGYEKILNITPKQFYKSAIHYVFLKKLSFLVKDFDQNEVLKLSLKLKEIYKIQSLSSKLKGKRFDYLLLVSVKLIAFFFLSHTREVIINSSFEGEIYTILVYVLLGTEVGERAFEVIMERYKQKPVLKFNGRSHGCNPTLILPNTSNNSSDHKQIMRLTGKQTSKSKKRFGRAECKTGTALFHLLPENIENDKYTEIRETVKANLAVKEFVRKSKPKETLDEVLYKAQNPDVKLEEVREVRKLEKSELKNRKIFYTQMSCSLDLTKSNESLNIVNNHCLSLKPQKRSRHYQILAKQTVSKAVSTHQQSQIKLPRLQKVVQQYSYQAILQKKKSGNYWKKVIGQMKEGRFERVQRFPHIGVKIYFRQGELEEGRSGRMSETLDVGQRNSHDKEKENYIAEYLTERASQTPIAFKQTNQYLSIITKPNKKSHQQPSKSKKISTLTVLQQLKNQINIIEYSTAANVKEIYKDQKAFMNVYSSQPMDDLNVKLKKKSYLQLKEIEKKFQEQCEKRKQKIQHAYFS